MRLLTRGMLIALMAVGSVVMWLGVPFGFIYGASQLVDSSEPNMGIYAGLFVAIPFGMFLMVKVLKRLEITYQNVAGQEVQDAQVTLRRTPRRAVVRREHADEAPGPPDQWG